MGAVAEAERQAYAAMAGHRGIVDRVSSQCRLSWLVIVSR